ncbi:MAG: sulfatase [Planctomycetaceae bacterium]|nr:sulfatase [Planctomycetaceae bacterium]
MLQTNTISQNVKTFFVAVFFVPVFLVSVIAVADNLSDKGIEKRLPNFVIIIGDDSTYLDYGFNGSPNVKTPNLDRLASEGVRFTRFYSPAAVCSPLRQALLTGLYPIRNGAYPNHAQVYDGVQSLPTYLKPLGYRTACIGKTHFAPAANYPFDAFFKIIEQNDNKNPNELQKIETFIKDSGEQPFLLYVASHEPHSPHNKGNVNAYDPQSIELPPYLADTPQTRSELVKYYAEITYLDWQVGQVVQLLEKTGHADNTLIFFFSEQGNDLPHGKWTLYDSGIRVAAIARWAGKIKSGTENTAIIQYVDVVPTLIELAGGDPVSLKTGRADTLGNEGFDGQSFADVLLGKKDKLREYAFAQHTGRGINQGPPAYASRAVTNGHWKLIHNIHYDKEFYNAATKNAVYKSWVQKGKAGDSFAKEQAERYVKRPEWELYNIDDDPYELKNVAERPENKEIVSKLKTELANWMKQQGDRGNETELEAYEHQTSKRQENINK